MKMRLLDTKSAIHLSRVLSTFSAKFVDIQTYSEVERNEFVKEMNEHFNDETFDLNYLIVEMKRFIAAVESCNETKEIL